LPRNRSRLRNQLVKQYRGVIETDKSQIANAKLQLTYARVIAPITGRVGLRQVDPGNMVQVNDTNGIVVNHATATDHGCIFTASGQFDNSYETLECRGNQLTCPSFLIRKARYCWPSGKLLAVDNQIDTTTGTIKLKAIFDNKDNKLFPNQFVNVRLKVDTLHDATVMSSAAVQRGSIGTFAMWSRMTKLLLYGC